MAAGEGVIAPPGRRRMLVLTAAFTPMMAVAALPVTVVVAVVASIVSTVTAGWVGLVMHVAAGVGLGYLTARWAANYRGPPCVAGAGGYRWQRRSWSPVCAWRRSCRGVVRPIR